MGVEFAMIVQIASVYAALHTTRSFHSVRFSAFWSQTFYNSPLDGIPPLQRIGVVSVQIFPGSRIPPRERRGGQPTPVLGIVMKIQLTTPFHS